MIQKDQAKNRRITLALIASTVFLIIIFLAIKYSRNDTYVDPNTGIEVLEQPGVDPEETSDKPFILGYDPLIDKGFTRPQLDSLSTSIAEYSKETGYYINGLSIDPDSVKLERGTEYNEWSFDTLVNQELNYHFSVKTFSYSEVQVTITDSGSKTVVLDKQDSISGGGAFGAD